MGTSYYVYLGPYLECEYVVVNVIEYHWACTNERCPQYGQRIPDENVSFCGVCGKALGKIPHAVEKPSVDSWALTEKINEALHTIPLEYIKLDKPVHVWLPNQHRDAPREFSVDPITVFQIVPIGIDNLIDEGLWLSHAFHDEIELLQRHYKRCDIIWGLIVYAH